MVQKLRAIVAVEPQDPERELMQYRLQHRNQVPFTDRLGAAHHLPLRHRIHRVNVIHAWLPIVLPLMDRVHAQISGLPLRVRLATLSDRHLARPCVLHADADLAVGAGLAQIVKPAANADAAG